MMMTREELDKVLDLSDEEFRARVAAALRYVFSPWTTAAVVGMVFGAIAVLGVATFSEWSKNATQDQHLIILRAQVLALQESSGIREELEENQNILKQLAEEVGLRMKED